MAYNYFIPMIHLGIPGYTFTQELPLDDIKNLIIGNEAKLEIVRKVILNTYILYKKKEIVHLKDKKWIKKKAAFFKWKNSSDKNDLCYIETQVNLLNGQGLTSGSLPSFYANYISNTKKNFISCGNEKYGNTRVIMQMKEFGKWIDGYPAINVNYNINTSYSLVIINPYKASNSFTLEVNSLKIKKNFKVPALSIKTINFFDVVKKKIWMGQFYVFGKRRLIIYIVNHAFDNFNIISTIEHSDPFRAEHTYQPRLQYLRSKIHEKLKSFFN